MSQSNANHLSVKPIDPRIEGLPMLLREIAQASNFECAIAIAKLKGGQRVYLPLRPRVNHWMSKAVGSEIATAICKAICPGNGGINIQIPMGKINSAARHVQIIELTKAGLSLDKIAETVGVSNRTVLRHRRAYRLNEISTL